MPCANATLPAIHLAHVTVAAVRREAGILVFSLAARTCDAARDLSGGGRHAKTKNSLGKNTDDRRAALFVLCWTEW
jgi:hypothetical protein